MKYTPYRRTLAWIGFITAYILAPLALLTAIWYISHLGTLTYERPDTFYQQNIIN